MLRTFVPGFFLVEDQDDVIAGFRGMAPDSNAKVLLLVEGINLNTEWQFGPPDSILNGANLDYIKQIEVIRGPGSVTLGQGALLGVVNVVTFDGEGIPTSLTGGTGQDGYSYAAAHATHQGAILKQLRASAYLSTSSYRGQALRDEGWAHDRNYEGTEFLRYSFRDQTNAQACAKRSAQAISVLDTGCLYPSVWSSGSRLKRFEAQTMQTRISAGGFSFSGLYTDQIRDNYNFYRDRNEIRSVIKSGGAQYRHEWSDAFSLQSTAFYTQDDFRFQSHGGLNMAGVRENRYGGSAILNLNSARARNRMSFGAEVRRYDMGLADADGNNFIVNTADRARLNRVNENNRFVFTDSIVMQSLFAEDFFRVTKSVTLFGAFRYDRHPFWGWNVSPRLGATWQPLATLTLRGSYQEGFRGAVGVAYTGGYQGDGLLRNGNFDRVALARIPTTDRYGNATFHENVPEARPEEMRSFEAAARWSFLRRFSLEGVLFHNEIRNIIDVGVIFADPTVYSMPRVGNDQPGDWNGYFFFRNLPGVIRQGGFEAILRYQSLRWDVALSQATVRVLAVSDSLYDGQFSGGMYLTNRRDNPHFRAYPENVTRLNALIRLSDLWSGGLHYLYYPSWYSPSGNCIVGNHLLDAAVQFSPGRNLEIVLSAKNLLRETKLYPMNSNAGDVGISDGTPTVEESTYWLTVRWKF